MKFKLDENMPMDFEVLLRELGHDVASVVDEGLQGEADPPVLRAAAHEGRILLTFDLDFADIRHYPPGTHAGIVVFRLFDRAGKHSSVQLTDCWRAVIWNGWRLDWRLLTNRGFDGNSRGKMADPNSLQKTAVSGERQMSVPRFLPGNWPTRVSRSAGILHAGASPFFNKISAFSWDAYKKAGRARLFFAGAIGPLPKPCGVPDGWPSPSSHGPG